MLKISMLTNAYKYFLEHVFIIAYEKSYRLLIIHKWQLVEDRDYKTLRGAKIAFTRLFGDQRWKEYDEPEWSRFYNPGEQYFNPITNFIESMYGGRIII